MEIANPSGAVLSSLLTHPLIYGVVGSLALLISSWNKADEMRDKYLERGGDGAKEPYDFIVVGAGTAGSLLAHRLSQNYRVLLLEAGGEPHPFTSIPLLANYMSNHPGLDWMHPIVHQAHAFSGSSQQRQPTISGGKGLGGTSNLDYMIHLRGTSTDYDDWAAALGDPSWSYANVLKYFKRHEKYKGPWEPKDAHGTSGELELSVPKPYTSLWKRFILAGIEMGYGYSDLNSASSVPSTGGFDVLTSPIRRGVRASLYRTFLSRFGRNSNLTLSKYSTVRRVLFRNSSSSGSSTLRAYAVEYDHHGGASTAAAAKEILLSAGSINSPRILMGSGLGDAESLHTHSIPTLVHLPQLGEHLQDHVGVWLGPFSSKEGESVLPRRDLRGEAFLSYTMGGGGPLGSTGYGATALLPSSNVQLTLHSVGLGSREFARAHPPLDEPTLRAYFQEDPEEKEAFFILVSLSRPKSEGYLKLAGAGPQDPLEINPKYLEKEEDVEDLVGGIRIALGLVEGSQAFRDIGARFTNHSLDGCEGGWGDEGYWRCFVRRMALPLGHVVGTVGMGRVVDKELRVFGVEGLRVVDASVMPRIPSTGTSAGTLMIAEKAADMIQSYWEEHGAAEEEEEKNQSEQPIRTAATATTTTTMAVEPDVDVRDFFYPVSEGGSSSTTSNEVVGGSYVLIPKSTTSRVPSVKSAFESSVDAFVEKSNIPVSRRGPKFSRTLPILGFANVPKKKNLENKTRLVRDGNSRSSSGYTGATTSATAAALKVLIETPFKIATAPFTIFSKAISAPLGKYLRGAVAVPRPSAAASIPRNNGDNANRGAAGGSSPIPQELVLPIIQQDGEVPKDYDFMEAVGDGVGASTILAQPGASAAAPAPVAALPRGENYKIIYERNQPGKKTKVSSLAENVQEILMRGTGNSKTDSIHGFENDEKNLQDEVGKLLGGLLEPAMQQPIIVQVLQAKGAKSMKFTEQLRKQRGSSSSAGVKAKPKPTPATGFKLSE